MTKLVDTEPSSFEEEIEKLVWVDEMVEEYESIVKNSVQEVTPRLANKSIVGLRWICNVNHASDGSIKKYKAKLLAKGYSQVVGIDYEETFSLVASDEQLIRSCKEELAREFEMKEISLMHYFLGLEVWKGNGELFVSQGKYENEILQRFHMESCKPMETPIVSN
eukprot:PITA_03236